MAVPASEPGESDLTESMYDSEPKLKDTIMHQIQLKLRDELAARVS